MHYAPVSAAQSVKIVYALATRCGWKVRQFDVIAAYLNAAIDGGKVYMQMPTGFGLQDNVCLLNQALYSLRKAGKLWWNEFKTILTKIGFKSLEVDPCIFIRRKDGIISVVMTYVDDAIVASTTEDENEVKPKAL